MPVAWACTKRLVCNSLFGKQQRPPATLRYPPQLQVVQRVGVGAVAKHWQHYKASCMCYSLCCYCCHDVLSSSYRR